MASEFADPELLANVNSAAFDHLPRLSSDELTLWLTSERGGGPGAAGVWTAHRASVDAPFGTSTVMSNINGSGGDESAALTQDGLVLVFDSTREGDSDVFITTRTSTEQDFPTPAGLGSINSSVNEYNVFLRSTSASSSSIVEPPRRRGAPPVPRAAPLRLNAAARRPGTTSSSSEIERLRPARRTAVGLRALKKLHERSPEDELQLHTLTRLERRLSDRIAWMEASRKLSE